MQPTDLLYLVDFCALECSAKVVDVADEDERQVVYLDQTIFYPQGGGQPYDKGVIESEGAKFLVSEVRFVEGQVKHIGQFERGTFKAGDVVKCIVDEKRRELNSRLHTAGHVVDMSVNELKLDWTPGKGFHFPEGPYVEYSGNLNDADKEKLKADLEKLCNDFIAADRKTSVVFMEQEKMREVCHFVPDYLPEGKPARVVLLGDFGVPCGGTHVASLAEIIRMTIRKIKPESGKIRVAYDVVR